MSKYNVDVTLTFAGVGILTLWSGITHFIHGNFLIGTLMVLLAGSASYIAYEISRS